MMRQVRYVMVFTITIVFLTVAAVAAYGRIGAATLARESTVAAPVPVGPVTFSPRRSIPTAADYERYAEADKAWRAKNAREFTLAELRARGDGKRSARQALDDRVYALARRGENSRAINELERWVDTHPRDKTAILALARMLRETGRNDAAVARYRQLLSLDKR